MERLAAFTFCGFNNITFVVFTFYCLHFLQSLWILWFRAITVDFVLTAITVDFAL